MSDGACCGDPRPSLSQGVHESRGVTKDYLRLETLVQKVVSPYLGTYGLYSGEGSFTHSCVLGRVAGPRWAHPLCPGPGRAPGPGHSDGSPGVPPSRAAGGQGADTVVM